MRSAAQFRLEALELHQAIVHGRKGFVVCFAGVVVTVWSWICLDKLRAGRLVMELEMRD